MRTTLTAALLAILCACDEPGEDKETGTEEGCETAMSELCELLVDADEAQPGLLPPTFDPASCYAKAGPGGSGLYMSVGDDTRQIGCVFDDTPAGCAAEARGADPASQDDVIQALLACSVPAE